MPRFNERRGGDRRQDDNAVYEEQRGRGWYRHEDGPWSPYNGGKRSFERTHTHDERRFDPRGREYWRENDDESPREWSERDDRAHARPSDRWDDRREVDRDPWGYREHLHDPLAEEDELWGNEMGTPADQPSGRSIPRGPDWQSEPRTGETWIARDEHFRGPGGFHRDARDYGRDRDMRGPREPRDDGREMRGPRERHDRGRAMRDQRDFGRDTRGQHDERGFGRDTRGQHDERGFGRDMRGQHEQHDERGFGRDMRGQQERRDMRGQQERRDMRGQDDERGFGRDMRGQHDERGFGRDMRGQHDEREMRGQPDERDDGRDMHREQRDRGREMRGHEQRYVGGPVRDLRDYGRDLREHRDDYDREAPAPRDSRDFDRDMRGQRDLAGERGPRRDRHAGREQRDRGHDMRRDQRGYTDEPGRDLGAFHGDDGSMSRREYGIEGRDFRAEQSHELHRDRGEPWHGSETRGSDEYGRGLEQRTPEDRFRPENREWATRISGRGDRRRR